MKTVTIDVKIGKTGEVGSKVVKCDKVVWEATDILSYDGEEASFVVPNGYTATKMIDLLNYAEDLKRRAACRQVNTDEGNKPVKRQRTMLWMVQKLTGGDPSFWNDYQNILETDVKGRNEYLDELYANEYDLGGKDQ